MEAWQYVECADCRRLRANLAERAVVHCSACGRWQYAHQPVRSSCGDSARWHRACVECHETSLCRGLVVQASPEASSCAQRVHLHPAGQCDDAPGGLLRRRG